MRITAQTLFLGFASLVVLVAVVAGFWLIGAPGDVRLRRLDAQRVESLVALTTAVDVFTRAHGDAPESLGSLLEGQDGISVSITKDPETGATYEFRKTGVRAYELCARFARLSDADGPVRWRHGPGRQCFLRASPDPASVRGGPVLEPLQIGSGGSRP